MKIIQIPFCFYPDPPGGTEVYVEALSRALRDQGLDIVIAAPAKEERVYTYNRLKVIRFAVSDELRLDQLYGKADPMALEGLNRILDNENPDILHLHAFTPSTSSQLFSLAKKKGIKAFFTYHTPTASCQRGTLMYLGKEVCDGRLKARRCSKCKLQGLGLNLLTAAMMGSIPHFAAKALAGAGLTGGAWTALRMSELVSYNHDAFYRLLSEADQIVAVCDWAKALLIRNGVSRDKVTVIRQGLCHDIPERVNLPEQKNSVLNLAYFGRIHPTKGIDIIITALKRIPKLPVRLDLYGILQGDDEYYKGLLTMSADEPRITFKEPVPAEKTIEILQNYDFLIVPSQWMETGPMVILEAFAAGVPVIASRLGGIAEIVSDEINGILIEPRDLNAWAGAIERCFNDRTLRKKLQRGIEKPKPMDYVASEMKKLYLPAA
ncbi:MAG: glycosyltransferase [Candidatus Omnitrophota bacterium]